MDLFEVKNGKAIPSVHAYLIEPFKSMLARDESPDKAEVIKILTYVELLCSPKKSNPFHGYNDSVRPDKVKENVFGSVNYQSDLFSEFEIIQAVETYGELLLEAAPGYDLYLSALSAAQTLKNYLNSLSLDERTTSGAMVIKPADITKALNDIPNTITSLQLNREKMLAEIKENSKNRNNREIGPFER